MGHVSARAKFGLIAVAAVLLTAPVCAQGTGVLFITSDPSGVTVTVDGETAGTTPLTLSGVKPGLHTVATKTKDYVDVEATITVTAGEVASVPFALTKATGSFVLTSDLVGMKVYLDGAYIGDVVAGQELSVDNLMVGPHTLRLEGPFFSTEQSFATGKGEAARTTINGQSLVGSLSVSTGIPASGLSIGGIQVARGAPPYVVPNMAPGTYVVTVLTEPVPYLTRVTISAGRTEEILLDASEDVGKVLVAAPLAEGDVEVTIDGVLVAEAVPAVIDGIVKGPHTVEVTGRRSGAPADAALEPLVMGRQSVWVTGGDVASVTLSVDALTDGGKGCPEGMVRISPGVVEGEFWFQHWADAESPALGEGEPITATRGSGVTFTAPGTSLTLKSVDSGPVQNEQKRDVTTGGLLNETKWFAALADVPYCIDIYEYPNRRGAKPAQMSYFDAAAACAEEGKRLCSSVEWVRACVGPEGSDFPYGAAYQPARCNTLDNPRSRGLAAAGSYADCVNGYGLFDMSGNAAEWTMAETMMTWSQLEGQGHLDMTERRLLYTSVARNYDSLYEHPDSPKIDLRGGSWLSKGWDASCRAMPSMIGSYIAAAPETGGAAGGAGGLMMGSGGPMMGGAPMMGSSGPMMGSGGAMMGGAPMMGSSGPMMGSGAMMGSGGPMMGGPGGMASGGGGASQAAPGATVSRGAGADSRYLGSARLRGFRCCTFAHGLGNAASSEAAGTGGAMGGMMSGPGMMGGGAGSLLGAGGGTH